MGCHPWGHKGSGTTEQLTLTYLHNATSITSCNKTFKLFYHLVLTCMSHFLTWGFIRYTASWASHGSVGPNYYSAAIIDGSISILWRQSVVLSGGQWCWISMFVTTWLNSSVFLGFQLPYFLWCGHIKSQIALLDERELSGSSCKATIQQKAHCLEHCQMCWRSKTRCTG